MKTVGMRDEDYNRIKALAEEANIPLVDVLQIILEYALPKVKVRTETRLVMDDLAIRREPERVEALVAAMPVAERPPIDTSTIVGKIKAILSTAGRPLNMFEIKQAWRDNYPDTPLPQNIHANMQGSRAFETDRSVIPHVCSLAVPKKDKRGQTNAAKGQENARMILAILDQGHSQFGEIVNQSGLAAGTVGGILRRLALEGRVTANGDGTYNLPA